VLKTLNVFMLTVHLALFEIMIKQNKDLETLPSGKLKPKYFTEDV
jgi:hypothetical protein